MSGRRGLIIETGKVLLDREMDHPIVDEVRNVVEADAGEGDTGITDLHVLRIGKLVPAAAIPATGCVAADTA